MNATHTHGKLKARAISIVALVAIFVLVLGAVALGVAGTAINSSQFPEGTTVVTDSSTEDGYKLFPTNNESTSFDTTEYAGRLWADKTVYAPTGGAEGNTQNIPLVDGTTVEVDKTESGTFLTDISVLSSSLSEELVEPQPLDIVLVLDLSGSMADPYGYIPFTPEEVAALVPGQNLPANTYFTDRFGAWKDKKGFEGYMEVSPNADHSGAYQVSYLNKAENNTPYYYILTNDSSQVGVHETLYYRIQNTNGTWQNWQANPYDFIYTQLAHRDSSTSKLDELKKGVNEFVDLIAENNSDLAAQGYDESAMSRISIVRFAGMYMGANNSWNAAPNYTVSATNGSDTKIVTPLTTYATTATGNIHGVSEVKNIVNSFVANHSTAADFGLTLAKGVLEGKALVGGTPQEGLREDTLPVVVFFTDGNPKHGGNGSAPKDFQGVVAKDTMDISTQLKAQYADEGMLVFSVAVVDGANASDTTKNINAYLNGVSSNYLTPSAEYGSGSGAGNTSHSYTSVYGTDLPSNSSWWPTLGAENYQKTTDTEVKTGKTYYKLEGGAYVAVSSPTPEGLASYYEKPNFYYVAGGEQSLSDAFRAIATSITSSAAADSTTTGRDGNTAVTITDYLGDYMEFKGINGIIYGITSDATALYAPGTQTAQHVQAQVQRDDTSATDSTYTMWYEPVSSALLNPPEGKETVNLNLITIQVHRSTDPATGDTVTIKVPPELIPSLRYSVSQEQDASGVVSTVVNRSETVPLRILYTVGAKASTQSGVLSQLDEQALRSASASNESDRQTEAYQSFIADAAQYGAEGIYKLYANTPPTGGKNIGAVTAADGRGTTVVDMVLSTSNPYYFFVEEEPLFIQQGSSYARATTANAEGKQLFYRVRVFTVSTNAEEDLYRPYGTYGDAGLVVQADGSGRLFVPKDTPRNAAEVTNVVIPKAGAEPNPTETATSALVSVFDSTERVNITAENPDGSYVAHQYLGNNGRIDVPVGGTLAITKDFTAGEGFVLPADPVPTANLTVSLFQNDGHTRLTGSYKALLRDAEGHPLNHETHAVVTGAGASANAMFTIGDGGAFTLRDGETLKITGLPDGAKYTVVEQGTPGFAATVENNDGTVVTYGRGEEARTTQ